MKIKIKIINVQTLNCKALRCLASPLLSRTKPHLRWDHWLIIQPGIRKEKGYRSCPASCKQNLVTPGALPDRVKFHRACPGLPSKAKHSTRQRAEKGWSRNPEGVDDIKLIVVSSWKFKYPAQRDSERGYAQYLKSQCSVTRATNPKSTAEVNQDNNRGLLIRMNIECITCINVQAAKLTITCIPSSIKQQHKLQTIIKNVELPAAASLSSHDVLHHYKQQPKSYMSVSTS